MARFSAPLVRNGYSLVASAGITSALGVLYWLVVARLYTLSEVGLNAALISTLVTLGNIGQLNLANTLIRFLPNLNSSDARMLVLRIGGVGIVMPFILSIVFLAGVDAWVPRLHFLTVDHGAALLFTAAAVAWSVSGLQDGVLTGVRKAIWIPIKNSAFAVGKLVLLIAFAHTTMKPWGPFASWSAVLLVTVVSVHVLMFRRLLRTSQSPAAPTRPPDRRTLARYFGADTSGELLFLAATGLAPILVLERIGPEGTAVYYLCWTITYSLYFVSEAMAVSLVAEGTAARQNLRSLAANALSHTMMLLALAVGVVAFGAPLILRLFGPEYAADGVALLRVLALSAIPFGFTSVFLGVARVEGRMSAVVIVQGALMALVLGMGVPLLELLGTLGMGIAWLAAHSVVALALLAFSLPRWRQSRADGGLL